MYGLFSAFSFKKGDPLCCFVDMTVLQKEMGGHQELKERDLGVIKEQTAYYKLTQTEEEQKQDEKEAEENKRDMSHAITVAQDDNNALYFAMKNGNSSTVARYINESTENANVEFDYQQIEENISVAVVVALRDIQAGEELFANYNLN